jgi:hypothetical protein
MTDFLSFGNDQSPCTAKFGSDIFGKLFQQQMLSEKRKSKWGWRAEAAYISDKIYFACSSTLYAHSFKIMC